MRTLPRPLAVVSTAALMLADTIAFATSYTWSGAGEDGCWTNPANWLIGGTTPAAAGYPGMAANGTPTTGDVVYFQAGATADITLDHAATLYQLVMNQADLDVTFRGGASGTNAPLTVSNTFNVNASGGRIALDNFGIVSTPGITLGASRALSLENASFLRVAGSALAAGSSLSLDGGSGMLVAGNLSPVANGNNAISVSGGSRLEINGTLTLTAGNTLALSGASSLKVTSTLSAYLADSLSLAGESTLNVGALYFGRPGQSSTCDNSTIEVQGNCFLGNAAPGGGSLTFRGANPRLLVRGLNFRYDNNNAAMAQPFVFNYVVPEGGFAVPPLQHLANTATTSFYGQGNPKAVAKFTVDAASPALSAGTTTTTALMLSQPGITHIAKAYADISDTTAALAFAAADGVTAPTTDIATKMIVATAGSGPDAEPPEVAASAVSPVFPVDVAHKTLTAHAAVTALSTEADTTVLRLYAGHAANGSDAEVVLAEDISSIGIHDLVWTAPDGAFEETFYLFAEVADLDGEGLTVASSTSDISSAKTVDAATYTWVGGASGNWSDPANWSDNQEGNCIGYPDSTGTTAEFPASTKATVVLDGAFTVRTLNLNKVNYDLAFTSGGATTNAARLTVTAAFNLNASGGAIAFDGVGLTCPGFTVGLSRTLAFRSAANVHSTGDAAISANSRFVICEDSWFSLASLTLQDSSDNTAYVIIDNATVALRGNLYAPNNNKGATLRMQGSRPLLRFLTPTAHFRSIYAAGGSVIEFLVPAGGYDQCPIQGTGAMSVKLGNNGTNNGASPIAFRVMAESPALSADASFTQPLVSWATAGINTAMLALPAASETVTYVCGGGTPRRPSRPRSPARRTPTASLSPARRPKSRRRGSPTARLTASPRTTPAPSRRPPDRSTSPPRAARPARAGGSTPSIRPPARGRRSRPRPPRPATTSTTAPSTSLNGSGARSSS